MPIYFYGNSFVTMGIVREVCHFWGFSFYLINNDFCFFLRILWLFLLFATFNIHYLPFIPVSSKIQLGNYIFLGFSWKSFNNSTNIYTRMFKVVGNSFQFLNSSLGTVTISDGKYLPLVNSVLVVDFWNTQITTPEWPVSSEFPSW